MAIVSNGNALAEARYAARNRSIRPTSVEAFRSARVTVKK